MLKSVIFDLDETLLDWSQFDGTWLSLHQRSMDAVCAYLRELHPQADTTAFLSDYLSRVNAAWEASIHDLRAPNIGVSMIEAAAALGVPAERIDLDRLLTAYGWEPVQGTQAFPEVIETLRLLRDAGLRFGIVTNAEFPMSLRDRELEGHGLAEFFPECRFSAADHGYLKPHPSIFRAALDCLDSTPDEAAFVGDDLDADIIGAQQAGLFAVYRRSRGVFSPSGEDARVTPNATISSLSELPAVFDAAFPGWRR